MDNNKNTKYIEKLKEVYYASIKALIKNNTLLSVQDYILNACDDTYDFSSFCFELVLPLYDCQCRIPRNGRVYDCEYVLFLAYSLQKKDLTSEHKRVLLHVFVGMDGSLVYEENDNCKIYENILKNMTDDSGLNIIEVYSKTFDNTVTSDLIVVAINELDKEELTEKASTVANGLAAGLLVGQAAKLGRQVRRMMN